MSQEELHARLGKAVVELKEIRSTILALEQKSSEMAAPLMSVGMFLAEEMESSVSYPTLRGGGKLDASNYPSREDVVCLADDYEKALKRKSEVERLLGLWGDT